MDVDWNFIALCIMLVLCTGMVVGYFAYEMHLCSQISPKNLQTLKNLLMNGAVVMKWTSDPPTNPGWYFYQRIDFPGYPIRVGVVKTVYYNEKGYLAVCENWETDIGFCIADLTCKHRWAGPIPEPVEPEEKA